jgi:acetylglutamate kinase
MKVELLLEALPYIKKFRESIFVVKIGGEVIANKQNLKMLSQDIALLHNVGIKVIVVHGGGKYLTSLMKGKAKFIQGLRYTDAKTLKKAKKAFGTVNKILVDQIRADKEPSLGIPGYKLALAIKKHIGGKDLGFVGQIKEIKTSPILSQLKKSKILVISPLAKDSSGQTLNVNADELATHISSSLNAKKIIFITNVDGVLKSGKLISELSSSQASNLIKKGIISGGMLPKVRACTRALSKGVKNAHIINGKKTHSLLKEIFTDSGIGTMIRKS